MLAACGDSADTSSATTRPLENQPMARIGEKQVQARLDASSNQMTLLAQRQKLTAEIRDPDLCDRARRADQGYPRGSGRPALPVSTVARSAMCCARDPLPAFTADMPRQDMPRVSVVAVSQTDRNWFGGDKINGRGLLD